MATDFFIKGPYSDRINYDMQVPINFRGNQLLCFAELKHLQRLLTAINGKLLLLPICQLERRR
ncbi:hypothetical protein CFP56_020127 [Quercus suber]|uniref:Uncharacterized protein n=1 Tax=Quercus suber TaxID=58331 RepID=A0AAW0KI12_QUESU